MSIEQSEILNEQSILSDIPDQSQLEVYDLNYFIQQNNDPSNIVINLLYKLAVQVFEFYLELRNRVDDNLYITLKTNLPLQESQEQICQKDISDVWKFIQVFVEGLLINREEILQQLQQKIDQEVSEYEQSLQKLEAEIRNHIRIEQQLKLYFENTQSKLEEVEKQKEIETLQFSTKIQELEKELDELKQKEESKDLLIDNLQNDSKNKDEAIRFLNERIKKLEQISQNSYNQQDNTVPQKSSYSRAQTEVSEVYNQQLIYPTEESINGEQINKLKQNYLPSNNNSLSRFKLQAQQQKYHQQQQIQSQQNYNLGQTISDIELNGSNPNLYQYFQEKIMQRNDSKDRDINQIHNKLKKLQKILDRKPIEGVDIVKKKNGSVQNGNYTVGNLSNNNTNYQQSYQVRNNNNRGQKEQSMQNNNNNSNISNNQVNQYSHKNISSQSKITRNRSYTQQQSKIEKRHSSQSRHKMHESTNHRNNKNQNQNINQQQQLYNNCYISGNNSKNKKNLVQTVNQQYYNHHLQQQNQQNQKRNSSREKGIAENKSTSQMLSNQKKQNIKKKSDYYQSNNKYSPNRRRAPTPPVHSHTSRDIYAQDHQKSYGEQMNQGITHSPKPNFLNQKQQIKKRMGNNATSTRYLTERNK